jgi:hypothetical protein
MSECVSVSTGIARLPIEVLASILKDVEYERAKTFICDPILRQRFFRSCKNFVRNFVVFKNYEHGRLSLHDIHVVYHRLQNTYYKFFWICTHADCFVNAENIIRSLLADGTFDPSINDNKAIRWACENGHAEVVKLLLADSRVDPSIDDNRVIKLAAEKGHAPKVSTRERSSRQILGEGGYASQWRTLRTITLKSSNA